MSPVENGIAVRGGGETAESVTQPKTQSNRKRGTAENANQPKTQHSRTHKRSPATMSQSCRLEPKWLRMYA
eukprot:4523276-Heterocapsa_arctica.AAC.1